MAKFHYLARAVIVHDGKVLLARQVGASNTFLPGGHIDYGEPAKSALAREIVEETGLEVNVGDFLGAVEAAWEASGESHAEINLVFEATLRDHGAHTHVSSRESHLEFLWAPIVNVNSCNLLPLSMRVLLTTGVDNQKAFWGSDL